MRKIYIIIVLAFFAITVNAQKQKETATMYIYGMAFNPMDSVVYLTEIQPIQGAYLSKKTKFLYARNEYSSQLKNHMAGIIDKRMTTAVSYADSEKKILKKYTSQKKKFAKDKMLVKYVETSDFKFTPVSYSED